MKGLQRQSAVSHTDGGLEETTTTGWVEGFRVAAGHGGVVRRRHENLALCRKVLLVAAGHGGVVRRRHEKRCSLPLTLSTFPRGP